MQTDTVTAPRGGDAGLRTLLESLPAAAYTCDPDGLITCFNQRAAELWGRSPSINDPVDRFCGSFRLFGADGSPIQHDHCWMALALQENAEFNGHEIIIERPDGTRITALAHANPIRDEAGAVTGAVNVLVDITERKTAEEARAYLAAIVSSSQDAIIGKTLEGIITSWNEGAERLYGYTAEELIGQPISLLLPADRPDEFPSIMQRIRRGEPVEPYETVRVAKDGRRLDIRLMVSPVFTADGRLVGASAIAHDITERKQLEQANARLYDEAQAALHLRNEVLANVTHDLKNPLAGISALAQVLEVQLRRGREPSREQLSDGLHSIHQRVRDMARQLDELLDVAALDAGQQLELQRQRTELVSLVHRLAVDAQASTTQHEIRVSADSDEILGDWDALRLERVVRNLLTNAIKYSPEGGPIAIAVSYEDGGSRDVALLSIQDEGVGIPAADLPTIFDRFRRGANVSGHINGTGVGLSAVRQIVEQHGGTVAIESREGQGTRVIVRLPCLPAKASAAAA